MRIIGTRQSLPSTTDHGMHIPSYEYTIMQYGLAVIINNCSYL